MSDKTFRCFLYLKNNDVNKEIEKTRSEELEKKHSETSSSTNQTINQEEPVLQGGSAP